TFMEQHIPSRSDKWRLSLWYPRILSTTKNASFGHTTQIHQQSKYRQHTPSSQTSFLQRLIRSRLLDEIEGDMNHHCIKPF
ncbi:hypothetical protein CY34DRAFT_813744, partial [Suillus luteus UH-Slu-Lm8-n1]